MSRSGDGGERIEFDHVVFAVHDPGPVVAELAELWGLHVHPDTVDFADGVSNLIVPLEPPQYLELVYVRDAAAFDGTHDAALVEMLRRGGGLVGIVLRTSNLAAVSEALGVAPTSGVDLKASGPAPWQFVSRADEPHYPEYIEYRSVTAQQRLQRWSERFAEVSHAHRPGGIAWAEVTGSQDELRMWLTPAHHLDIRIRQGAPGATVAIHVEDRLLVLNTNGPGLRIGA
jgi:hypothetical protein